MKSYKNISSNRISPLSLGEEPGVQPISGLRPKPSLKICGMKHAQNITEVISLFNSTLLQSANNLAFIGFIFYPASKRYVGDNLDANFLTLIPPNIKKVGVFVDHSIETIQTIINKYSLDYAQLHGSESPHFCQLLYNKGIKIIKAISIIDKYSFENINAYEPYIHYFLFDTATPHKGGSGKAFDWAILKFYIGNTPFLLAGGINEQNLSIAINIKHPLLAGLDLNSRFEIEPGLKDINKLKNILTKT